MSKQLTVTRTTYGVSQRPVIQLDYNDGAGVPTFELVGNKVDAEIFHRLIRAQAAGFTIEYRGFETPAFH